MSTNGQIIFLLKCIESNGVKFDFAPVGQVTGLKTAAARMRYTRLRASLAEHLDGIEPKARARSTRTYPPPVTVKPVAGQKRRLSDESLNSNSVYGEDENDDRNQEPSDQSPPLKKRLHSAGRQQTPDLASDNGTVDSDNITLSEHTAVVNVEIMEQLNKPDVTSHPSTSWPIVIPDPRKSGEYSDSSSPGEQLQKELMDDIKNVLLQKSGSIDDLNRLNIEKSVHITPGSVKSTPDCPRSSTASTAPEKYIPPPMTDRESSLLELEFEHDYYDNITAEIIRPEDSHSEVVYNQYMEDLQDYMRLQRMAAVQIARRGRINKMISFLLRRNEEQIAT